MQKINFKKFDDFTIDECREFLFKRRGWLKDGAGHWRHPDLRDYFTEIKLPNTLDEASKLPDGWYTEIEYHGGANFNRLYVRAINVFDKCNENYWAKGYEGNEKHARFILKCKVELGEDFVQNIGSGVL